MNNNNMNNMNNMNNSNKSQIFCTNCGKTGHKYKGCPMPITSYGIITMKINSEKINDILKSQYIHKGLVYDYNDNIAIDKYNKTINKVYTEDELNNIIENVELLLICRRNSVGYIELIRGKYDINDDEYIEFLFKQMTDKEIRMIKDNKSNYEYIWCDLWNETLETTKFKKDYIIAKEKFDELCNKNFFDQEFTNEYNEPEWGFPKGRRNNNEKNLQCALREFNEETSLNKDDILILNKLYPFNEVFTGTDGIIYKHVYFIAIKDKDIDVDKNKLSYEIGDIRWVKFNEALELIRPYHDERKKIINEVIKFLANIS
jgi:ADP-ribose pyrophosphatase YjhB (NUDIX family)